MNSRGILRAKRKRHTALHEVLECLYFAIYIVFRGLMAPYNLYSCASCPNISVFLTLMCFFISLQSWFFMTKMTKILKKKVLEYEERKNKGVSLWWMEVNPALRSLTSTKSPIKESSDPKESLINDFLSILLSNNYLV